MNNFRKLINKYDEELGFVAFVAALTYFIYLAMQAV